MKKNKLAINATLNVIRQCCSIIVPLITFPYVSRVLGAENYGRINFSGSIISYVSLIAALGVSQYAVRECTKHREDQVKTSQTASEIFTINVASTAVSFFTLLIILFYWKRVEDFRLLLVAQYISVIFTTIGVEWLNIVYDDYLAITVRTIISYFLSTVLIFSVIKQSSDYLLYAWIMSASTAVPYFFNYFYVKNKYKIKIKITCINKLKKHLIPIMVLFASSVATLIYINSDILILGILKDDAEVGLYSVSAKIYTIVKQVINSVTIVFVPSVTAYIASEKIDKSKHLLETLLGLIISLIIPASVGLACLSEDIIVLISGDQYIDSREALMVLAFSLPFAVLACFFMNLVLMPLGKEKIILVSTIVSAVLNIVLNFVLIPTMGASGAAITTVIAEFIMFLFGAVYSIKKFPVIKLKPLIVGLLSGVLTYTIIRIIGVLNVSIIERVLSCMIISILLYLAAFTIVYRNDAKDIRNMLKMR